MGWGHLLTFRSFGPVLLPVVVLHVGVDGVRTIGTRAGVDDDTIAIHAAAR